MPAQHRVRADKQTKPTQELPRHRNQQSSKERTILRRERHPVPTELSFKDGDLVTQNQDLHILLAVAHRQKPHGSKSMGDSQVGEAQQHR